MNLRFARAVDPLFIHVLDLLDRCQAGEAVAAQEERLEIRALLSQAEARVGSGLEWDLASYALVSWIDEMLVDTPWDGQQWWSNNVLEVEIFNTRLCFERFYERAQQASTLPQRDALEVYYICVVLGFRGLYREPQQTASIIQAHGLPPDVEGWTKQVAAAIRVGQGRPPLAPPRRSLRGATPLARNSVLAWSWLPVVVLATVNVVYFCLNWWQ